MSAARLLPERPAIRGTVAANGPDGPMRVFVRRVTDNVLLGFAAGRAGRQHPARDTVTRYHLPDVNSVDAS